MFAWCEFSNKKKHIKECNILSCSLSGFRTRGSTTALLKLTSDVSSAIADGQITGPILTDLTKACDPVDHDPLLDRTFFMGVSHQAQRWLNAHIHNRHPCVAAQGVPLGCLITIEQGVFAIDFVPSPFFLLVLMDFHWSLVIVMLVLSRESGRLAFWLKAPESTFWNKLLSL